MAEGFSRGMEVINRASRPAVALETTLLVHGVPDGRDLARRLAEAVESGGAAPAFIGVHAGRAIAGLSAPELDDLLADPGAIPKANTANLGPLMHRRASAATTVSATMEIAAAAGLAVLATGGLGGVHRGAAWDISTDLAALTRFPVAVIASGVKSILDIAATREVLETLGIPVVGFGADSFPAFFLRESDARVDARYDDPDELSEFLAFELSRGGRGILVCQPVPEADQIDPDQWREWLALAEERIAGISGRAATPALLKALHEVSAGATLRANIALALANAALGARVAVRLHRLGAGSR